MAFVCKKCKKEEEVASEGGHCSSCEGWFHFGCTMARRLKSGCFKCDDCANLKEHSEMKAAGEAQVTAVSTFCPAVNSTMMPRTTGEDEKDRRIRELEQRIERLLSAQENVGAVKIQQHVNRPSVGAVPKETPFLRGCREYGMASATVGDSGTYSRYDNRDRGGDRLTEGENIPSRRFDSTSFMQERSLWRNRLPREVLERSCIVAPLTKDQIARRKTMNVVLPRFNGNPLQWLTFISAYLGTAGDICGFTPLEDMLRLKAALYGPAMDLVGPQMGNVENLEGVLASLQMSFGETHLILAAMTSQVNLLAPLKDDLSNIAIFAGQVDHLRSINNLIDGRLPNFEIIRKIEMKLPLRYGEEWLMFKSGNRNDYRSQLTIPIDGDINHIANFLLFLNERTISLGRNIPKYFAEEGNIENEKPKKKTVLLIEDHEEEMQNNESIDQHNESEEDTVLVLNEAKKNAKPQKTDLCKFKCGNPLHMWTVCPAFKKMSVKSRWHFTKRFHRCFLCLNQHQQKDCKVDAVCDINGCGKKHHKLLHPTEVQETINLNRSGRTNKETYYRVVPVIINSSSAKKQVLLLMDSGSSVTLIDEKLANELNLQGETHSMTLSWMDGDVQPTINTKTVSFELSDIRNEVKYSLNAKTYRDLKLPRSSLSLSTLVDEKLDNLPFLCYEEEMPLILLGQDNAMLMRTISSVPGASDRTFASKTPLGYAFEGERKEQAICLVTNVKSNVRMEKMLRDFIDGEHFGLKPDDKALVKSDDDRRSLALMEASTWQGPDGRFVTALLWQSDEINLPNNKIMAENRLRSFERKLKLNPVLRDKVNEIMRSHVANQYVRKAVTPVDGQVWYLPIFNVHNPAKPDKVRLVFDCAATFEGVSLNSKLLNGPDLTAPLVNVLLLFRTYAVAISGDLKDMYHRVFVREEDRCFQRFLWREDPTHEIDEYEMCALTFGAKCSPSLAQYVKNLNAERFRDQYPQAVDAIINEHYIDDWLGGAATEEEVIEIANAVIKIHASGGLQMHKFMSNSKEVLKGLGVTGAGTELTVSDSSILGVMWNTSNDKLSFRFRREKFRESLLDGSEAPTKREMLSVVMSIYDPIGLVSWLTIEGRIILREAWRETTGWDDKISGAVQRRWSEWTNRLSDLQEISIDRFVGTTTTEPVELHIFVDASETAMAAVCYVVQRKTDRVVRALIMGKCLVAPIRAKSIPRLELDAAVLGIRLMRIVLGAVKWNVQRRVFWTDAKDVLWWLRSSTKRYTPYVANRVSSILAESQIEEWRWTPTAQNPADWGTKWADRGRDQSLWWKGPDFIDDSEEQWPNCTQDATRLLEVRPLLLAKELCEPQSRWVVPDVTRFSRWLVFLNASAYANKFVAVIKKQQFPGPLSEEDLERGENAIFKEVQRGIVSDKTYKTFLSGLAPFFDENGVLRMRGRAARSENLTFNARFPVIVRNDHLAVELLIQFYHHIGGHQNTTAVTNELYQKVRMPHMRATVRRVIGRCSVCAIRRARPIIPQMGALPLERMAAFMPSFSYVGIDYFGPYDVLIGRRHEKRWGALMTCLTTRAVYLEIAFSLSTESCIAVLNSLVARRGMPKEIFSDNGTCFVGAAKRFVGPLGIKPKWSFMPPLCPSMGGAWERLVGVTKKALQGLALERTPTEERLRHAFMLAERLINSRPLTEIPCDPEEEECLTPNHFQLGSSSGIKPSFPLCDFNPKQSFERMNEIVQNFWTRWTMEYLPLISGRSKWGAKTENLKVGDIVFMCDDDYRQGWLKGTIVDTVLDKESGQVRRVVVQTADGRQFRRGATRVAPIIRNNPIK